MIAPGKCPVHPRGRLILPTSLLWFDAKSRKLSRFDAMTPGHATSKTTAKNNHIGDMRPQYVV